MERDAGSVRLTTRGHQLLDRARNVVRSMDDFIEASENVSLLDGVIKIGVTEMIVSTWLEPFLATLKERYPSAMVELQVDLSVNLETELAQHNIDIAFQSGPFQTKSTGNDFLGSFPITWVTAPKIKDQLPREVCIEHMTEHPIIAHARNTKHFGEIEAHFANRSKFKPRIIQCNNLSASAQMAMDGFGIAPMLTPMVEEQVEKGSLAVVNYDWRPSNLDFFARYDEKRASSLTLAAAEIASQVSNQYARKYVD